MAKVVQLRGQRRGGWAKDRWEWLRRLRRDGDLSPMTRLVGHSLAVGYANADTAECRPGAATLAEDCGTSIKTVERAMRELEAAGWLERLGGNAPGVKAAVRFRFPGNHPSNLRGEHPSNLSGEHPSDLNLTPLKSEPPPRPPYMEEPNLNHRAHPHPRAALRPPKRPQIATRIVMPGSAEAAAWDGWLSRQGHPPLDRIGLRTEGGGWLMPITTAPEDQDEIASRIARSWAGWLRSR